MVEAVPARPYGPSHNPDELLSAFEKLKLRRKILEDHFFMHGVGLASLSSPLILGTKDHILIKDFEYQKQVIDHEGDFSKLNEASLS